MIVLVPIELRSTVPLESVPASISISSKLTLVVKADTSLYGTAIPALNVEPVGSITPPELTAMLTPPLLKVVPVASKVPVPTTICPWPPPKPLPGNDTVSPETKESVPLSVSVSPDATWTLALPPTAIEAPVATVIGPPNEEGSRANV